MRLQGIKGLLKLDGQKLPIPKMQNIQQIGVIIGNNGVGKTLLLKTMWFISYCLYTSRMIRLMLPQKADIAIKYDLERVFQLTFNNDDDISCDITASYWMDTNVVFLLVIENGVLINWNLDIEDIPAYVKSESSAPIYLSNNAKSFKEYDKYNKLLARFDIPRLRGTDDAMVIKDFYPMYDMLSFETIYRRMSTVSWLARFNDLFVKKEDNMVLAVTDSPEFRGFQEFVVQDDKLYIKYTNGSIKKCSSLSQGTQSLLITVIITMD